MLVTCTLQKQKHTLSVIPCVSSSNLIQNVSCFATTMHLYSLARARLSPSIATAATCLHPDACWLHYISSKASQSYNIVLHIIR